MFNLENKTIIITGGAGLIGSAFSKACAWHQANVVIADVDEAKGGQLAEDIKRETKNKNVLFQKCDITDIKDIQKCLEAVLARYGRLDALVNNAFPKNKNYGLRFEDVRYDDFCDNVDKHLGGYFLMSQQAAKVMKKQGHGNIINIASIYGFSSPKFELYQGTNMTSPVEYAAIKGAIVNLTRYLASYLGRDNIRVNAISPGGIFDNQPESFVQKYSEKVVLGKRMAKTDDLTGALIFLLSDASGYMTGQNIIIDGGFTL